MKPLLSLLLALLSAVCCLGAQLSTDTLSSPATIDSLQARIDRLERRADRWDRLRSRLPEFSGYVQLGYEYDGNTSSFLIRRAQFALAGSLLPSLHYNVRLEFASPQILDAYLDYCPLQALNLRVGELKVPFSIENTAYPPTKIEFIHYPLVLLRMMGFIDLCGLSSTGRDMGLVLHGSFFPRDGYNLLHYDLGVLNGEGINTRDRNRSKDLAARLTLHPVRGLTLSGSYYWGEYGPDYRRRVRYGAGVCYDRGTVVLRSEWIGGETDVTTGDSGAVRRIESGGWYVMGGWHATRSFTPVVRYDTFLEQVSVSSTRQSNCTAGFIWQPVRYLRCQLDYTYESYAAVGVSDRNLLSVQFTGMF